MAHSKSSLWNRSGPQDIAELGQPSAASTTGGGLLPRRHFSIIPMPLLSITRLRVWLRPANVAGRWSILTCLGLLAALAGPPAWGQTWPSPTDLRDFALAEAHEAKLDARVRRHRPSPGNWLSTKAIEDTLAATQFRSVARAAKIGHAREIRIALHVWKPELYAAWRACKEGRGARATCSGIELQYAHARTAVSYVLAQREAAVGMPGAGLSPEPVEGSPPPVSTPSSTHP